MTLVKKSFDNAVEVRYETNTKHINELQKSGFRYFDLENDNPVDFMVDLLGSHKERAESLRNILNVTLRLSKDMGYFVKPVSEIVHLGTREYLMMDVDSEGNKKFYEDYEDSIIRKLSSLNIEEKIGYVYTKEYVGGKEGYFYPLIEKEFKEYLKLLTAWYNETIYDVSLLKDGELLEKIEGVPLSDLGEVNSLLGELLDRNFSKDSEYSNPVNYNNDMLDSPILT